MGLKKLLNIPTGYKIIKIHENEEELNITIEPYKRKKAICSGCGKFHAQGFHGTKIVKVRDLPIVGRKVYLHVIKRRYKCPVDEKIYNEEIDWLKKKEDIPKDLLLKYISSQELQQIKKPVGS